MIAAPQTMIEVIPAVDLRGGNCVRLHQGRFDRETLFDSDPVQAARRLSVGAKLLHVVDLDGARDGGAPNRRATAAICGALTIPLQCGGGVRSQADVEALLNLGASRVVIGSLAAERPAMIADWLGIFGPEHLVIALDAQAGLDGRYRLATRGWQRESTTLLTDALGYFSARGARHVLCTDINRDGTLQGPNLALYENLCATFADLQLQASGGVRDAADLLALANVGVREVIVGRALLEGGLDIEDEQCQRFV